MPKTKKPQRRNVPMIFTIPPEERARLVNFAARLGRPHSWCVRDALRTYLNAVEGNRAALDAIRAPELDLTAPGRTVPGLMGRPRKARPPANVH